MTHKSIYEPQEDSYLFKKFIQSLNLKKNIKILDMGCGSCIIADTFKEKEVTDITCADINKKAINLAKTKKYKTFHSNLFEKIPAEEKFDIICFNAPYLPEDNREPKESRTITTGGQKGDEMPLKFISQAKKHLTKNGIIYLLISSLTPQEEIQEYKPKIVTQKKIFFEELIILELHR